MAGFKYIIQLEVIYRSLIASFQTYPYAGKSNPLRLKVSTGISKDIAYPTFMRRQISINVTL